MPDTPGIPRDRDARPSLGVVLELRRDRMSTVRRVIEDLTDASLEAHTEPVEGPGWPRPRSYPVRECLLIVLNEEWCHRQFAERDLAVLESQAAGGAAASGLQIHAEHLTEPGGEVGRVLAVADMPTGELGDLAAEPSG